MKSRSPGLRRSGADFRLSTLSMTIPGDRTVTRLGAGKPRSGLAAGWSDRLCIMPSSKRKAIGVANGFHSEVHVQVRPVEVTGSWFLHV